MWQYFVATLLINTPKGFQGSGATKWPQIQFMECQLPIASAREALEILPTPRLGGLWCLCCFQGVQELKRNLTEDDDGCKVWLI